MIAGGGWRAGMQADGSPHGAGASVPISEQLGVGATATEGQHVAIVAVDDEPVAGEVEFPVAKPVRVLRVIAECGRQEFFIRQQLNGIFQCFAMKCAPELSVYPFQVVNEPDTENDFLHGKRLRRKLTASAALLKVLSRLDGLALRLRAVSALGMFPLCSITAVTAARAVRLPVSALARWITSSGNSTVCRVTGISFSAEIVPWRISSGLHSALSGLLAAMKKPAPAFRAGNGRVRRGRRYERGEGLAAALPRRSRFR